MEVRRLIASLAVLVGCSVGEVPVGGNGTPPDAAPNNTTDSSTSGSAGEASFNSMIMPLVNPRCTSCHSNSTPPNLSSFSALEAKYKMKPGSSNILVNKGDHAGIQYFNTTERMTVQNWIDSL